MKSVIDLPGASGETYRFRRLDDLAAPPATAGNFANVRWDQREPVVLYLGVADSLSAVQVRWAESKAQHQASNVFVRLNVGRETREREHDDLLQCARPVMNGAALKG
jgi:hypothetical protein